MGGWELRRARGRTAGGGSHSCLVTSDEKGPLGRTGAHLTELRLKVKFLEAVSSPSPSSRERHPHKATRRLLGLMSEIDGVIQSLNLLSVLATGGAHTPHREELPCCWLVPDRLSKASNWICCVSLPTPHQPVSPPSCINKHIFQQGTCQAHQRMGSALLAQLL